MTDSSPDAGLQRLLDECEQAFAVREWDRLDRLSQQILAIAPENAAALRFRSLAVRNAALSTPPPGTGLPPEEPSAGPRDPAAPLRPSLPRPSFAPPPRIGKSSEPPAPPPQGVEPTSPPQAVQPSPPPQALEPTPPQADQQRSAVPPAAPAAPEESDPPLDADRLAAAPQPSEAAADDEVEAQALLQRASAGAERRDWREARRYARAALVLAPDSIAAASIVSQADQALSAESLAAIQAAAQVTQRQLSEDRARRRFPLAALFAGLSLPRLSLAWLVLPRLSFAWLRLPRLSFAWLGLPRLSFAWLGLPRLSFGWLALPRVSMGGAPVVPIVGAATLFVLAGLAAFIALGQLSGGGDGGDSVQLAASRDGEPTPGVAAASSATPTPEPTSGPTPAVAGDQVEAPIIEAVGCRQLEDGGATFECRPTLTGAVGSYAWEADGGEPATGDEDVFRTVLPLGGPYRIGLEVCTSGACASSESQAFVVSLAAATPEPVVSNDPPGPGDDPRPTSTPAPTSTPIAGPPPPPAPTITAVTCTPSPAEVGETVVCSGSFGGGTVATYDWSVNGFLVASSTLFTSTYDSGGERTISLQVCNAGGCDTDSTALTVDQPIVLNPPVINQIGCAPTAVRIGTAVNCDPTIEGDVDSYDWGSGSTTSTRSTFFITYPTAGGRVISLEVCNDDGCDQAEAQITVTLLPPLPAPVLEVSQSAFDFGTGAGDSLVITNDGELSLDWEIVEAVPWLIVGPTSGSTTTGSDVVTLTVDRSSFGPLELSQQFSITSNGGNATISVSALPLPPDVTVSCDPLTVIEGGGTSCTVSNSGGDIGSYEWSDSDGGVGSEATYAPSFATAGPESVSLTARNAAGSSSDAASITVNEPAPVVTISCDPNPVTAGDTTTCSASNSGGTIATWAWADSDGGFASTPTFATSFADAGTASVSLVASNASGNGLDSLDVTVTPIPPSAVSISCTTPVDEDVATFCSVTGSSGGAITTYAWSDDGDGGGGSGASYSPTFATAGDYTVTLIASNAGGVAPAAQALITVEVPLPAPSVSIDCTPNPVTVGLDTTCTATNSGGPIETYAWAGGTAGSGSSAQYVTSFLAAGPASVGLVASNATGISSDSFDVTVTPTFTLTVDESDPAGGTASGDPGPHASGASVAISTTVTPGWTFTGWTGSNCAPLDAGSTSTSATITANTTCTANFVEDAAP